MKRLLEHYRDLWRSMTPLGRVAAIVGIALAAQYGGSKGFVGRVNVSDPYIQDAGSYLTNDVCHVAIVRRSALLPDDTEILVYARELAQTNAADWVRLVPYLPLSAHPHDYALPNATNHNVLVAANYVPAVAHTNGAWSIRGFVVPGSESRYAFPLAGLEVSEATPVTDGIYDAEVEYLRTDGNEYILTDVVPDSTIRVAGKFKWRTINAQARLFGSNSGTVVGQTAEYSLYRGGSYISARGGNIASTATMGAGSNGATYTFDYTATGITFNGTRYQIGGVHAAGRYPIALFGRNNLGTVYYKDYKMICDLYWIKFWKGGALIHDFAPVRKGSAGCLYDRVSGRLYGNRGTGEFGVGPDK